jgi:hypothetical protein
MPVETHDRQFLRHLDLSSWVHVCGLYLTSEPIPDKAMSFHKALYSRMPRRNREYKFELSYSLIDTSRESFHDAL